jgi:GINS complex subunit 4
VSSISKALIKEKQSPEILMYEEKLVKELDELIFTQEKELSEIWAKFITENIFSTIYKLDIERMKYLLKSYLRTRLLKLQKYYLDVIKNKKENLISQAEFDFLSNYFIRKKMHFMKSFGDRLPIDQHDFIDPIEGSEEQPRNSPVNPELVTQPDTRKPVFVKITKAVGKLGHQETGVSDNLKLGDVIFMPYDRCKDLLESEVAELT